MILTPWYQKIFFSKLTIKIHDSYLIFFADHEYRHFRPKFGRFDEKKFFENFRLKNFCRKNRMRMRRHITICSPCDGASNDTKKSKIKGDHGGALSRRKLGVFHSASSFSYKK